VVVNEDYLTPSSDHSSNMAARRKQRNKKQNVSIHQFDEQTQKSIQDALDMQL